jgi:hypothetical protein
MRARAEVSLGARKRVETEINRRLLARAVFPLGGAANPLQKDGAARPSALAEATEESTHRRIVPSYTSAP